jgi:Zn-dependent alcohol dehydrogenase
VQEWTAEVAAALDLDVTGGEQDCLLTTWRRMLSLRAVDVAQPDVCYLGGLTRTLRVAQMAAAGFVDEQVIRGCYFGSSHLQRDVPALTGHYLAGDLLLDELITARIGLDELNDAFDALRAGKGARSVLVLG